MDDKIQSENNAEIQAMATPTCPDDGSILVDGEVFGYPALVCPMCDYWKIKLPAS